MAEVCLAPRYPDKFRTLASAGNVKPNYATLCLDPHRQQLRLANCATNLVVILIAPAPFVRADALYTWTDNAGKVHYSTSPETPNAKKAELPDIKRENLSQRIQDLRTTTPPTCSKHGGIDCAAGEDSDGSVICVDGNRDAVTAYRAACMEVKLSYAAPIVQNEAKEVLGSVEQKLPLTPELLSSCSVHITLRNRSAVQAKGVNIKMVLPGSIPTEIFGPDTVEPFGVADYIFPIKLVGRPVAPHELREARFKVRCENCSSVSRVRD